MSFFTLKRMTQFAESDAAGIIHFSTMAKYVEEAEHAFLAIAGYPIEIHNPNALRWPRVKFKANYAQSLYPLQKIQIHLDPIYIGKSSINWKWSIIGTQSPDALCGGEMKVVCCSLVSGRLEVIPLPDPLRERLIIPV